jgi:glucan phosphoethanolaminetransferase (alkaline phosphatase superfamily)
MFFALIIMGLMFFFPVIRFIDPDSNTYELICLGVVNIESGNYIVKAIPLTILLAVIVLLLLITIFSYKNRIMQMRLSVFNILLMLGSVGLIYFYSLQAHGKIDGETFYLYPVIFPVVSAILAFLAFRGVKKDEELVRSYDRIR